MGKKYICEQACFLGGKRYEVDEELADGVEPNSHFKDKQTGERVKAKENKAPLKKEGVDLGEADQKIDGVKLEAQKQLDEFKALVGKHLADFEKRIAELEKLGSENKGLEPSLTPASKQPEAPLKPTPNKN